VNCPDISKPDQIAALPTDERGYPIFFAIQKPEGGHDFKRLNPKRVFECIDRNLCAICGKPFVYYMAFVGGPKSCYETRYFSDPPFHESCARYAAQVCPFILHGGWDRSKTERGKEALKHDPEGLMGRYDALLYVTRGYSLYRVPEGALLFRARPAVRIERLTPESSKTIRVIEEAELLWVSAVKDGQQLDPACKVITAQSQIDSISSHTENSGEGAE